MLGDVLRYECIEVVVDILNKVLENSLHARDVSKTDKYFLKEVGVLALVIWHGEGYQYYSWNILLFYNAEFRNASYYISF